MRSRKSWLSAAKLYLILDAQVNDYSSLLGILKQSVDCGIDLVQLRDKKGSARDILSFCVRARKVIKNRIPFILNDRVDLAMIAGVDGVHLGQDDIAVRDARRLMGSQALIGVSCQTLDHARRAQSEGADYIGFGSVFKTQTKPERQAMDLKLLSRVVKNIKIPVFAIGGITCGNIGQLRDVDVQRVAVCREICESRNVDVVVQSFKQVLK